LDGLSEEYDGFIITILSRSDPYTTDELESLLLAQEERFKKHKMLQSSIIQANHVTTLWFSTRPNKKSNFHSKGYCGGHTQTRPPHLSSSTSFSGSRTTTRPSFCPTRLGSSHLFPADPKF